MTKLTPERIEDIEGRLRRATPGPWRLGGDEIYDTIETPEGGLISESVENTYDADFIAHARQDVEDLLCEVRRLSNGAGCAVVGEHRGPLIDAVDGSGRALCKGHWGSEPSRSGASDG